MTTTQDPLRRYEHAVDDLASEMTEQADIRACNAHFDCIGHVWLAPWWARWARERRLSLAMRRHVALGPLVERISV